MLYITPYLGKKIETVWPHKPTIEMVHGPNHIGIRKIKSDKPLIYKVNGKWRMTFHWTCPRYNIEQAKYYCNRMNQEALFNALISDQ